MEFKCGDQLTKLILKNHLTSKYSCLIDYKQFGFKLCSTFLLYEQLRKLKLFDMHKHQIVSFMYKFQIF